MDRKNDYDEVGRLEMALKGAVNNVDRVPVNQGIRQYGGKIFEASEYEHIKCLTKTKKTRYLFNFTLLRQELSKEIPEWHPFKLENNTPLLKWIIVIMVWW